MPDPRFGRPLSNADVALRMASVALTFATASIHLALGGLLFTLNAFGYFVGAAALVAPIAIAVRFRWLIRLGLAGYAATTIAAWLIQPAFYQAAYAAKVIELLLIGVLVLDLIRRDGNPIDRLRDEIRGLFGRPQGPASGRA